MGIIPNVELFPMAIFDYPIVELSLQDAQFSFAPEELTKIPPRSFHGDIIGQPRAIQALKLALEIPSKGYNLFVTGDPGSGRTTAVKHMLGKLGRQTAGLQDIICIHNFEKPHRPVILSLPPGQAVEFSRMMRNLTLTIQRSIIDQLEAREDKRINPEAILTLTAPVIDEIRETLPVPELETYLHHLQQDLREYSYIFTGADGEAIRNAQFFLRYQVNILVDHQHTSSPPVVFEHHPTSANLFGFIDPKSDQRDDAPPPFLSIHPGSMIEESGGYLVLNALDLLKEEQLWDQFKRVLSAGLIYLHNTSGAPGSLPSGIKPDPVHIHLKAIVLGDEEIYEELYTQDPDFPKLFKVAAEFDYSMPVSEKNIGKYIGFISMVTQDEQLLRASNTGIAEILKFGCQLVEQRSHLSTQFSRIADTIRESSYWAAQLGKQEIDRDAVKKALEERRYVSGLTESKIIDQIVDGEILIHLQGKKIGMVNALAVLDRGTYSFGIPAVITATVAPGNEGIVNIEHEAGLSGEIHDKGLLILEGYLRKMYARNFPLSIYSGICFEQSYAEVDGDSASSSELFALLSAIGDLPVRQDIAVTGSVNQMGEFQPVGGINEKIAGFFTVCRRIGLTGHQGVIIPGKNIRNLILPDRVLQAIEERKFHIYPVKTIDQGMQILTERPAGRRNTKGLFPIDTINRVIEDRLKRLYELSRQQN